MSEKLFGYEKLTDHLLGIGCSLGFSASPWACIVRKARGALPHTSLLLFHRYSTKFRFQPFREKRKKS